MAGVLKRLDHLDKLVDHLDKLAHRTDEAAQRIVRFIDEHEHLLTRFTAVTRPFTGFMGKGGGRG
jgi:hypothetical protein